MSRRGHDMADEAAALREVVKRLEGELAAARAKLAEQELQLVQLTQALEAERRTVTNLSRRGR